MATQTVLKFSIRKNDTVQVMAGKEKGKTGKVLQVNAKTGRITIDKVNQVKRHVKPSQQHPGGGLIEKEGALHYSNVLLMCPKCSRGVRHGRKLVDKKKIRVCKRCESSLETA